MKGYRLPPNLMMGAATAAAQIEGGRVDHNWGELSRKGLIRDGSDITRAGNHWENWRQDIDIAAAMGITTYRFSVEWARIEPEEGKIDRKAIGHYRDEILYMKECGIVPLLTLHHFSNPQWFEKAGAFAKAKNAGRFLKFTGLIIREFGDLVSDYVTFNEPNVYALMGYLGGGFPPRVFDPIRWSRVLSVMCACHILAYRKIHRMREAMGYGDTKVGIALHMRAFAPEHRRIPHENHTVMLDRWLFQDAPARAFLNGDFHYPVSNLGKFKKDIYCDYLGINYYTRSHVRIPGEDRTRPLDPKTDFGWEIYPMGLEECMRELYAICPRPIWITENGVCDEYDNFRCLFLYEQLQILARTSLPVERYYHWSLLDNFEWLDGESRRFGLVHVDFETDVRKVKKSGFFYQEIIRSRGVTHEAAERYLKGEKYHL